MLQAANIRGAIAPNAAPSASCLSSESRRLRPQQKPRVGVKFSSYHGNTIEPVEAAAPPSARSSKTWQVQASLKDTFNRLDVFNLGKDDDSVELAGKLTISKKAVLDLVNPIKVIDDGLDLFANQLIVMKLVSVEHEPGRPKQAKISHSSNIEHWNTEQQLKDQILSSEVVYGVKFRVPKDFGEVGAFLIDNNHAFEFYVHSLELDLPDGTGKIQFPCNSWVYPASPLSADRVFFRNKVYLPDATPPGLVSFREQELKALRGDGSGLRKVWDRIYDYDIYNDLGFQRPNLGNSKELPYPRRCRTGRPKLLPDFTKEAAIPIGNLTFYVPCDESFTQDKNSGFLAGGLKGILHAAVPVLTSLFDSSPDKWDSFEELKSIYSKGFNLDLEESVKNNDNADNGSLVFLNTLFAAQGSNKSVLKFPRPQVFDKDENAWFEDEEYGRQTLSGLNPIVIKLVEEFPPKSPLDAQKFGPASALTEKHLEPYLEGLTVREALGAKRLFTVDYRDMFLPYIEKINSATVLGSKAYAPRSIFFLTGDGKMKPVAIELSLPASGSAKASNRVFTPPTTAGGKKDYLWELAKLHAATIDFGFHELVSHWLRTHAVMEPFIIATNRQLSKLHPVHTLLLPTFKNTMFINAAARQALISANGIIELTFSPGSLSMEISSKVYGATWQFDQQALPQDLIARKMAVPADDSHPGGVKLVVEDYPYAKDGLELWDILEEWVGKYLNIVYGGSDNAVKNDRELQAWWTEVVNVGHADKKNAPGWPKADSIKNLTQICSTIYWIGGPHHAAVNFGQYAYAGYMPNRPSKMKRLIPEEGTPEYKKLVDDPETYLLHSAASQTATSIVMLTIELLATHAVDEEYQGTRLKDNWISQPEVEAAFKDYAAKIEALGERIQERNANPGLPNRRGPAEVPYTLLYPKSSSGLTGQGVPYSISI